MSTGQEKNRLHQAISYLHKSVFIVETHAHAHTQTQTHTPYTHTQTHAYVHSHPHRIIYVSIVISIKYLVL